MHTDSIETLLLRHYGSSSPTPAGLEQSLVASVRREAAELQQAQSYAARLSTRRISRRRAVGLVAVGSAGLGVLSLGLESLHLFEASLAGQDTTPRLATS